MNEDYINKTLDALIADTTDDTNGAICPACDVELVEDRNYLTCPNCGYENDNVATGNAINGKNDGITIRILGEGAGAMRRLVMKDGIKDPLTLRRDAIREKYKRRNNVNGNVISLTILEDATNSYYEATMTKTFRAEKANQIMSAILSYACLNRGQYRSDLEISKFMGLKCKGISVGKVIVNRLARVNPNILIPKDVDWIADITTAMMEMLHVEDWYTARPAIVAMVRCTYQKNIEPSYTLKARILGLIKYYNDDLMALKIARGGKLTTDYIHSMTDMSEATIERSYRDFKKYRSHLKQAIRSSFVV